MWSKRYIINKSNMINAQEAEYILSIFNTDSRTFISFSHVYNTTEFDLNWYYIILVPNYVIAPDHLYPSLIYLNHRTSMHVLLVFKSKDRSKQNFFTSLSQTLAHIFLASTNYQICLLTKI